MVVGTYPKGSNLVVSPSLYFYMSFGDKEWGERQTSKHN